MTLRRAVVVFYLFFVPAVSLSAQVTPRDSAKHFLWKVQSKNNTVYVLGSVHLLKKENYPLSRTIEDAFKDTEKLVLEIDPASLEGKKSQWVMLTKGTYEKGKTLRAGVPKATYRLAGKRAEELGINIKALDKFEPWFAALTIAALKLQQLGFDPKRGVDRHFADEAKKTKKEILGLETAEYQISLFDEMTPATQGLMLLKTLKDLDVIEKEVSRIVESWASGDIEALETLLLGTFKKVPKVYKRLIVDRNRNWLPKIETFLAQEKNYMVIVGAGHLLGRDGLIELLRHKGYSVEQL
ncbi:MAG: TraB/GumN family protein [Candidatus Binatia bacterium]